MFGGLTAVRHIRSSVRPTAALSFIVFGAAGEEDWYDSVTSEQSNASTRASDKGGASSAPSLPPAGMGHRPSRSAFANAVR